MTGSPTPVMSASAIPASTTLPLKSERASRGASMVDGPVKTASGLFQAPVEDHFALAWTTGLSALILAVAILGCFQPEIFVSLSMSGSQGKSGDGDVIETTMAELASMEQRSDEVTETVMRPEVTVPHEVPVEPPAVLDLPELLPALTQEDVFSVPAAPPIEKALTPVDPVVRKPAPPPPPTRSRSSSSSSTTGSSSSMSGSGRSSSGSGSGSGSATSGSGGKGSFPQPSYPSYARSRGMEGTVTVTIYVASDGSVTSTSVSGSSGHSTLDKHAASWVRRYWKFPGGASKTYRVPIVFRLR